MDEQVEEVVKYEIYLEEKFNKSWQKKIQKKIEEKVEEKVEKTLTGDFFKHFYLEPVNVINIFFLYINTKNEIQFVKKEKHMLENNILKKRDLLKLIKKYKFSNRIKYKILSILQYNVALN